MNERQPDRSRKRAAKATLAASAPSAAVADSAELRALAAERDRLRFELDTAQERIKQLEAARDQALTRIAWVIDSLHSLQRNG